MSGHVRIGEDERVLETCQDELYRQDIWWLVIYFSEDGLKHTYFQSSAKANLKALANFIRELEEVKAPHIVFAIWHGRNRTDAFLIDPKKIVERFGSYEGVE